MYRCNYFAIHELVPPQVFKERGEFAWELLDDRGLITLDMLRSRYGKMTVNNYYWGGAREWSGLRTPDSPYYSPYSQHTFGRGFDVIFDEVAADEVRKDVFASSNDPCFKLINSIELGVDWFHFDVRNSQRIKTYYPAE